MSSLLVAWGRHYPLLVVLLAIWASWAIRCGHDLVRTQRLLRRIRREQAAIRLRQQELSADPWPEAAQRVEAYNRSRVLLLACLDNGQRYDLLHHHGFIVTARSGQKYHIRESISLNVDVLDNQFRCQDRLCLVMPAASREPLYDLMLAQKLLLEANEVLFLYTANSQNPQLKSALLFRAVEAGRRGGPA